MNLTQDPVKKALAVAYANMMQMDAWKDLERFAELEKDSSIRRVDSKPASDLSLGEVCEERGLRKGITKLLLHASHSREGI